MYRATHQFFFSRRSVYLLVWEPRKGVQASQVEEWLKILRLRVGHDARVIIVSTYAKTGEHIARIDKPVLIEQFGSMIIGFHEVDSLVKDDSTGEMVGIAELKLMIADAASGLDQMGMQFGRRWKEARDELLDMPEPHITFVEFSAVCARHELGEVATKTLAHLMHDLGYIVYYGDDEKLKNDVVLKPEWLTKAIGFVLEDKPTHEQEGILPDTHLHAVWHDHTFQDQPRYDPILYPFFLRLMEKYDVSYRLENGTASLVAQHVPQVRPGLPWLAEEDIKTNYRRIAMVCEMNDVPEGLVPWMIVRTHDYAYDYEGHRLQWQKGMFLKNKKHGEALLELRDREFHVYAEAVFPEFFMNVLRTTLQKLITDNWPGMEGRYTFSVPCKHRMDGKPCPGRFQIDSLRQFLEEGDEEIRCQTCRTRQSIVELLYGFEQTNVEKELAAIREKLEGLDSRIANYFFAILQAIATESKDGPRLFLLTPIDPDWKKKLFANRYRIHLYCEAEGETHLVDDEGLGVYEFDTTREWVTQVLPYAQFVVGVLKVVTPIAAPVLNIALGPDTTKNWGISDHLEFMKEFTHKSLPEFDLPESERQRGGILTQAQRSGILALHSLLRQLDPNHERLGLKRVPTYTGEFRWLCQHHYDKAQSRIPDVIPAARTVT